MRWDIVTLSLGYGINPDEVAPDVAHMQNLSFPDCDEFLVVNDAAEDVGSGGSVLNALIRTTERLCYRENVAVLTDEVLQNANILIVLVNDLHAIQNTSQNELFTGGRGYIFDTYLTNAIRNASMVAEKSLESGVWVIGSDSCWTLNEQPDILSLPQYSMTGFTFSVSKSQLNNHGWYRINGENKITGMEFNEESVGSNNDDNGSGFLIVGFVYLPFPVLSQLFSLYSTFPVAASTYLGVDSNVLPLKLSLFFDFMLATCIDKETFIANKLGASGKVSENVQDRSIARKQIFRRLHNFEGRIEVLDICDFQYKEFGETKRSYQLLSKKLLEDIATCPDVEKAIHTELSIRKLSNKFSTLQPSLIIESIRKEIKKCDSPDFLLRMIYISSLTLSIASEGKGGLRNGPAKNPCLMKMEQHDMQTYLLHMLDEILKNWITDPSKMIRAARHLETAAQKFIRKVVDEICIPKTLQLKRNSKSSISTVNVTSPARVDFFGGWLDTPPIFFSMKNAAVVNMAVQLDGKNPVSCLLTKIDEPVIEVCQDGITIQIKSNQDLLYCHDKPTETGSLVCACVLALGFEQLSDFFTALNCTGLRIETKSDLPHGSGLGTSSTIAAIILRAFSVFGELRANDILTVEEMIIHTVLRVEQIMTTGGGWQDQIGSIYPGLKRCYYVQEEGANRRIAVQPIPLDKSVIELLERRILLVYTGKTRLAKNLLQEVIRNFFTCPLTNTKLSQMAVSVDNFVEKIQKGEFPIDLVEEYHSTKKLMTRSEPPIVTKLLEDLQREKLIEVGWAAGAGGGGFLYLWITENTQHSKVETFLNSKPEFLNMTCHRITIPTESSLTIETF